jgi:hypothetical protein
LIFFKLPLFRFELFEKTLYRAHVVVCGFRIGFVMLEIQTANAMSVGLKAFKGSIPAARAFTENVHTISFSYGKELIAFPLI